MSEKRDLIVTEIKEIYSRMNYNNSASELERKATKILELIKELNVIDNGDHSNTLDALFHTINKEVKFTFHYENLMNKKNAAKIRKAEFKEAMSDAISQIHSDIFLITLDKS